MTPDALLPAHLAGRLRPCSGLDEDYVLATRATNAARVCNDLVARCLGIDEGEVATLPVHDRDLALVAIRWATLGAGLGVEIACPECDQQHDVTIDLDRLSRPADPPREIAIDDAIVIALPTAGEQVRVVAHADDDATDRRARLIAACLIRIGEQRAPFSVDDVRALSIETRDAVERAMEAHLPDIDLRLQLACPACMQDVEVPVQLAQIVLAELRERSRRLRSEVHVLARTYHWSEREILQLSCGRRREYLALIEADHDAALYAEARD